MKNILFFSIHTDNPTNRQTSNAIPILQKELKIPIIFLRKARRAVTPQTLVSVGNPRREALHVLGSELLNILFCYAVLIHVRQNVPIFGIGRLFFQPLFNRII